MERNNKLLITRIVLYNFKGFRKLDLSFDQIHAVILGGKNGFGKTTLFDAIELVFTGEIKRFKHYQVDYHNNRCSLGGEELPLVYDKKEVLVKIEVYLSNEETQFILCRQARTEELENPVNFNPFKDLYLKEIGEKDYHIASEEDKKKFGIFEFFQQYSFINYLGQEESTTFLKSKESDRSTQMQMLFNTKRFDIILDKLKDVCKGVDDVEKEYQGQVVVAEKVIENLNTFHSTTNEKSVDSYIQLVTDQELGWDKEEPNLSNEDFNSWICPNGTIDNLISYIQRQKEYEQHLDNEKIQSILSPEKLNDLSFYLFYRKWEKEIKLYKDYYIVIKKKIGSLTLDKLSDFSIDIPEDFSAFLSIDAEIELSKKMNTLASIYASTNKLEKAFTSLVSRRTSLANALKGSNDDLHLIYCPLCGQDYKTPELLDKQIEEFGEFFKTHLNDITDNLPYLFEEFQKFLNAEILIPIEKHFYDLHIDGIISIRYEIINLVELNMTLKYLDEKCHIVIDENLEITSISTSIQKQLQLLIQPENENIDFSKLSQTANSYVQYIDKDKLTIENVEQKRQFLISKWNVQKSQMLQDATCKRNRFVLLDKACKAKKAELNRLKADITNQKTAYLNKVIADIEILFYIYSGRIMQNCYYGRGLFIKNDLRLKRVLFVSQKYSSDVDVLYNMSSGQLVSVMMSFLLSLNRLYSQKKFLAIDDPVQTIDDINLWGLVETLRHEFKDYFILLSTHEKNYGSLLKYKFSKWGIESHYYDMLLVHKENTENK